MNILIVEDNPISAKIVDMTLAKHGYSTILAEDGEEAWKVLTEKQDVQLMIGDLNLPNLDGLSLIERMHTHAWLKDLPVIVVSSENNAETVAKAADLGVIKYVVKPIKASHLLRDVKRILGHNRNILSSQREIQMRMEIDRDCYQEMIQSFIMLVQETVQMLRKLPEQDDQRLPVSEIVHLAESAELLGADRLHRFVDRLTRLEKINTYHYFFLLHELEALQELLPVLPGHAPVIHHDDGSSTRVRLLRQQIVQSGGSGMNSTGRG
ncbi:response regulator [bacterium]|nr:response regulator [bacterium]